jgi:hypothetical protein
MNVLYAAIQGLKEAGKPLYAKSLSGLLNLVCGLAMVKCERQPSVPTFIPTSKSSLRNFLRH